jgi:hypothetical protein
VLRVEGSWCRVLTSCFLVQAPKLRVQGSGFGVEGPGFGVEA